MDIIFNCPECTQQLEADSEAAGSPIECPTCGKTIQIPAPGGAPAEGAPAAENPPEQRPERHFVVPQREKASDQLIQKPKPPLEAAAKDTTRKLRIKTIRRGDCQEVGKDRFDETVTLFLEKIGEANLVAMHPVQYSRQDLETRQLVTDYALMLVYKG